MLFLSFIIPIIQILLHSCIGILSYSIPVKVEDRSWPLKFALGAVVKL